MVQAKIPHHTFTYGFGSNSICSAAAGMNGNRTEFTDVLDGTVVADVNYCYDGADRLIATTVPVTPAGDRKSVV